MILAIRLNADFAVRIHVWIAVGTVVEIHVAGHQVTTLLFQVATQHNKIR
jgi:hypothetical protein